MITTIATTTTTPDTLAGFAQLDLDPRRYWLRAHQRAVARACRMSAVYERAWRRGDPAFVEWQQLREADRCERFCYAALCHVMDWR